MKPAVMMILENEEEELVEFYMSIENAFDDVAP